MNDKRNKTTRQGAALLVVLFIVMAITILSLGFLSRSDVELACGENMILRTQMDYLAESGLVHAKGLILSPQDVDSEYWTGAVGQQLIVGSDDYYDVNVVKLDECNYQITCDAYREKNSERIGRSSLEGELRLDPCIAYWVGRDTTISQRITINGDVHCNGILTNSGVINGDVFANGLSGNEPSGQRKTLGDLSLNWPRVTAADFTSKYPTVVIGAILSGQTFGPYNPVRVCHRNGDLELAGGVTIDGMLVVEGDLRVGGSGNIITAGKNLPALLVTGDVIIASGGNLDICGLAVVDGQMQVSADAAGVTILGGVFVENGIVETTADSSGNSNTGTVYNGPSWQPFGGQVNGALEFDGVDDYIQTSDDLNKLQLTGDYTLAVWIKADSTQKDWAGIFSKCNASGSTNHWTLQFDTTAQKKLIIHHSIAIWDTGIRLSGVAGEWHHIRIVLNGERITSYLDGSEAEHSNTWNENPGSGEGHLNIGVDRTASSDYVYKGLIDDVRVYDRAPDVNEIYPSDGLVGHWTLDEQGSGNISITAVPLKTAIVVWSEAGVEEKWGQAVGAFFRSIERK